MKLIDLCIDKAKYGINASAVEKTKDEDISYLRITDIKENNELNSKLTKTVKKGTSISNYLLKENDIVFARTGNSVGKNYFYDLRDGKIIYAGFLVKFSINPQKVYPKYIKYYMQSYKIQKWIKNVASDGSTRPNINAKQLGQIPISLPSKEIQEKIANSLWMIDTKIKLNNQINDNLISLATALFNKYFPNINSGNEMIGNFISNYDRLRKPLSKKERLSIPGKYRYIGATSVNDYINKYNFDGIYLLLGEDGTVEDANGYPILQYISGKFWPNNHAHVLQGKNVSTEWLYLFFKQRKITSIVTGAVQKKISQKNLNSLSISIPDKDKLARFDTIINPIFKNIRIIESENHSLEKIKIELLSKLF